MKLSDRLVQTHTYIRFDVGVESPSSEEPVGLV